MFGGGRLAYGTAIMEGWPLLVTQRIAISVVSVHRHVACTDAPEGAQILRFMCWTSATISYLREQRRPEMIYLMSFLFQSEVLGIAPSVSLTLPFL
jgi:hypothetical protein